MTNLKTKWPWLLQLALFTWIYIFSAKLVGFQNLHIKSLQNYETFLSQVASLDVNMK